MHLNSTFHVTLGYYRRVKLKRCMHKLSKSQKGGFEKIAIEVVDMQTAKIQLNSGIAKYILYIFIQLINCNINTYCCQNN